MDAVVVERAQRDPIGEVGGSTVRPPSEVVGFGVAGWVPTPRERTPAVPFGKSLPLRRAEQAPRPPQVEDLTGTAQDGGDDVRVGGKKPGCGGGNPSVDAVDLRGAETVKELVETHPHHHRHHRTVPTGSVTTDRMAEEFFGRIGAALRHRAVIRIGHPSIGQR